MTNAEKYLKDGAGGVQDFTEALMKFNEERKFVTEWYAKAHSKDCIDLFLNEQATPQLTEDERVILRNIQKGLFREGFISRTAGNELFVFIKETGETIELYIFNHLFQFIEPR